MNTRDLLPNISEELIVATHPRIDLLKLLAEHPRDPYQLNKELGITYKALYIHPSDYIDNNDSSNILSPLSKKCDGAIGETTSPTWKVFEDKSTNWKVVNSTYDETKQTPYNAGFWQGEKLGNHSTAVRYFKEAIVQQPGAEFEQVERAISFIHLGNYSRAIEIANQILNHDPTNVDGLGVKGIALVYLGKNNAALNIFNTLISEGHITPWVLDNRG